MIEDGLTLMASDLLEYVGPDWTTAKLISERLPWNWNARQVSSCLGAATSESLGAVWTGEVWRHPCGLEKRYEGEKTLYRLNAK